MAAIVTEFRVARLDPLPSPSEVEVHSRKVLEVAWSGFHLAAEKHMAGPAVPLSCSAQARAIESIVLLCCHHFRTYYYTRRYHDHSTGTTASVMMASGASWFPFFFEIQPAQAASQAHGTNMAPSPRHEKHC